MARSVALAVPTQSVGTSSLDVSVLDRREGEAGVFQS